MHLRRSISVLALLSLLASLLTLAAAGPAAAQATTVFINELHYDNADGDVGEAVEVAGPAGTDLSTYSLELYNGNGGASYQTVALSGTLPDDGSGYGFASVPVAGIQNGSPDGLALVDGGTVVQFLSYEGVFTASDGPAAGMTSTDIGVAESSSTPEGYSLQLTGSGNTYEDFTWAAPSAASFGAVNTDQSFVAPGGNTAPTVTSDPMDLTVEQGQTATATITATDDDGTVQSLEVTSPDPLPTGITFTSTGPASGTLSVDATTPAGSYTITYTATDDEGATGTGTTTVTVVGTVLISQVQGDGSASPLDGQTVRVQGILTSLFEDADTLDAFFLQEEDADSDGDPATSEGIFVFCRGFCPVELAVGDQVTVTGQVDEFFGMTQLEPGSDADITIDASGLPLPTATAVQLPADGSTEAADTFEYVEGMVVVFGDTLVVSEYFELARFGQIVLTVDNRPYQYTHDNAPSVDGYAAYLAELETRRIILDDNNNDQNDAISDGPDEPYPYPSAMWPTGGLSTDNDFRGGDTITALTGVMHWSWAGSGDTDAWRIRPIDGLSYDFASVNTRPATPDEVGGDLTVVSFNVLNYFTTIDETSSRSSGPCGPSGTFDCRGADSAEEFQRQQAKIVAALLEIDADVVGLIEIENNATAVQNLVDALNAAAGEDIYAQIDTGTIGTDAIKVGFIYQTDTVAPVGGYAILDSTVDPRFIDTKNRPALIQSFTQLSTGGTFTAAVNHFKSKGSDCAEFEDESIIDGQANCSETRRMAAEALADYLADDPTNSGDPDFLILGDLNAYRMEDAIAALEDSGYVDLIEFFGGQDAYSFVFDGQLGYLDYALANNALFPQITGATEWHINADEVPLFDYNDEFQTTGESSFERESAALPLYNPDPYRASDHDPVIVGLDLTEDPANDPPRAVAQANETTVQVGTTVEFDGSMSTDDQTPSDELDYAWDLDGDQVIDATTQQTEFTFNELGTFIVTLTVTDEEGLTDSDTVTITVVEETPPPGPEPPPGPGPRPGPELPPGPGTDVACEVSDEAIICGPFTITGDVLDLIDPADLEELFDLGDLIALLQAKVPDGELQTITVTFVSEDRVCLVAFDEDIDDYVSTCSDPAPDNDDGEDEAALAQVEEVEQQSLSLTIDRPGYGAVFDDVSEESLRLFGATRIQTAFQASRTGWVTAPTALLASAGSFADALAAAPVAGAQDAPLLLTDGAALSDGVLQELQRLEATQVMVLGGTAAISADVENALTDAGLDVRRIGGADRTETAELLASEVGAADGLGVVAAGGSFADPLAIAPIAAMQQLPIYLTSREGLTDASIAAMQAAGVSRVLIIGGTAVIPQAVVDQLTAAGIDVDQRLSGPERYATGAAVLNWATDNGVDTDEILVATGADFPDALTAGALGGRTDRPVLLVDGQAAFFGGAPAAWLAANAPEVELAVLLGGEAAINDQIRDTLTNVLR